MSRTNMILIAILSIILATAFLTINLSQNAFAKQNIKSMIDKAIILSDSGEYEQAIEILDQVLEIDSNNIAALIDKGFALDNLGRYEEAITYYDKALDKEPNNLNALNSKGADLINLGRYEEAITYLDKVLAKDPNYLSALYNKGLSLSYLGKEEEAITYYDKVLDKDPNDSDALVNKGLSLGNLRKYEEAISMFDKAIEIKPDDANAWFNKGLSLFNLTKYKAAIEGFDKALEFDPTFSNALTMKNEALKALQDNQNASLQSSASGIATSKDSDGNTTKEVSDNETNGVAALDTAQNTIKKGGTLFMNLKLQTGIDGNGYDLVSDEFSSSNTKICPTNNCQLSLLAVSKPDSFELAPVLVPNSDGSGYTLDGTLHATINNPQGVSAGSATYGVHTELNKTGSEKKGDITTEKINGTMTLTDESNSKAKTEYGVNGVLKIEPDKMISDMMEPGRVTLHLTAQEK